MFQTRIPPIFACSIFFHFLHQFVYMWNFFIKKNYVTKYVVDHVTG